ncbi:hypothetical protein Tco_0123629 [Tanacetum coccineum]
MDDSRSSLIRLRPDSVTKSLSLSPDGSRRRRVMHATPSPRAVSDTSSRIWCRIFHGLLSVGYSDVVTKDLDVSLEHFDVVTRKCDAVSMNFMPSCDQLRIELQACPVSSQIEYKSRVFAPNAFQNAKITKK